MLYLFELMAKAAIRQGLAPPIKEPGVPFRKVSDTAAIFPRFL
jgi:hypothetical protein